MKGSRFNLYFRLQTVARGEERGGGGMLNPDYNGNTSYTERLFGSC